MKRIIVSALKGAACIGALACCLVATPAAAEVVVRPRTVIAAPVQVGFVAPPVVYRERPAGFWYGGRWQGPIVNRGYGWHERFGWRGYQARRGWGGHWRR